MKAETAYIVLFRGVGGATQLPVARLREVLPEAGFHNVSTYINSGNAVLSSRLPEGTSPVTWRRWLRKRWASKRACSCAAMPNG